MRKTVKNRLIWWVVGIATYVMMAWRYTDMRTNIEPFNIVYRRGLMNKLASLLGGTVSMESHPDFYGQWSTTELVTFNTRLVAPETLSPLIRALDDEYRGKPWDIHQEWDELITITGKEPEENGNLDWSGINL